MKPYDPLEYENLARNIAEELMKQDAVPLAAIQTFEGVGVYAIYYIGDFPAYHVIAEANKNNQFRLPIYVGKATLEGMRKGRSSGSKHSQQKRLYQRLKEHARSIRETKNLHIKDFYCRHLVVVDVWVDMAEQWLIDHFHPVWNMVVEGFGIHTPGGGRSGQQRSLWDTIHPGRKFAERLSPNRKSEKDILDEVERFLRRSSQSSNRS
jgi:hypothetical protein